jgi:hypothetical protein
MGNKNQTVRTGRQEKYNPICRFYPIHSDPLNPARGQKFRIAEQSLNVRNGFALFKNLSAQGARFLKWAKRSEKLPFYKNPEISCSITYENRVTKQCHS